MASERPLPRRKRRHSPSRPPRPASGAAPDGLQPPSTDAKRDRAGPAQGEPRDGQPPYRAPQIPI